MAVSKTVGWGFDPLLACQKNRIFISSFHKPHSLMNTQADTSLKVFDVVKQVFSVFFVIFGIAGFYYFFDARLIYRVSGLLASFLVAMSIVLTTERGISIRTFILDSKIEVRKIVWPTREETTRTTLLVFAMVSIVSLVLWLLDTFLFWGIRLLTNQGL